MIRTDVGNLYILTLRFEFHIANTSKIEKYTILEYFSTYNIQVFLTSSINNAVLNSLDDSLLSNEEPLITSNNALQDIYYTLHSPQFYE